MSLRKDLEWWVAYMSTFDGVSIIPTVNWQVPDVIFSTDACLESAGGWSEGEYFKTRFPEWIINWADGKLHINELEMIALLIGLKVWSKKYSNRNFLCYCDNRVTVEVVNTGKANNRFAQACLRKICFITAKHNAVVKVVHIIGVDNRISDCLSCWGKDNSYRVTYLDRFYVRLKPCLNSSRMSRVRITTIFSLCLELVVA